MTAEDLTSAICPLCGESNACSMAPVCDSTADLKAVSDAKCAQNSIACWCADIKLNELQREQLSVSTDATRCLCQRCLSKLTQQ